MLLFKAIQYELQALVMAFYKYIATSTYRDYSKNIYFRYFCVLGGASLTLDASDYLKGRLKTSKWKNWCATLYNAEMLCKSIKWLRVQCSTILGYKVQYSEVTDDRNEIELPPLLSAQRCLWHVLYILEFCPEKKESSRICFVLMYFVFFLLCTYVLYLLNLYLYTCLCVSLFLFCVFLSVFLCFCASGDVSLESWQRQPKSHYPTHFLFDLLFSICFKHNLLRFGHSGMLRINKSNV